MKAVAEFDHVSKSFPGSRRGTVLTAAADVSLRVERGEVLGLIGPNRAGKTTLLKMLLSLCRPSSGRVLRFGRPAAERATLARIGYVHESPAFPRHLGAAELLGYCGALSLLPEAEVQRRVPPLLEQVGLADRSRESVAGFSRGMLQRLALAQALLTEPDLLVLDEPSEGLDAAGRRLVCNIIRERRRLGQSVLFVSHVLADVEAVCDRAAVLVEGKLVRVGPPAAFAEDPASRPTCALEQACSALYAEAGA